MLTPSSSLSSSKTWIKVDFAKFATLSKLQSVVKDALKSIKKVVSPDAPAAAKAAANALDRIAAANKEQEKQPEKEKQPIAEESNRDLRTPARRAPPPPGRGATSTRGGSLLDEFATDLPAQLVTHGYCST